MKQLSNKQLRKIANQIAQLEQECQKGNNVSENLAKMASLVNDLDEEDTVYIYLGGYHNLIRAKIWFLKNFLV